MDLVDRIYGLNFSEGFSMTFSLLKSKRYTSQQLMLNNVISIGLIACFANNKISKF